MMHSVHLLILSAICYHNAVAFVAPSATVPARHLATKSYEHDLGTIVDDAHHPLSRKKFVEGVQTSFALLLVGQVKPAHASGGATAGGAYLLSAKQRYNKRVTSGLKAFLAINPDDLSALNAFFSTPDEGGWEDLSAAAYLLANAFRTNSSKAPDSLPSVKSWKSFSKEVDLLKRGLAKNDKGKVASAYSSAEEKLDEYLANVELPTVIELKQL